MGFKLTRRIIVISFLIFGLFIAQYSQAKNQITIGNDPVEPFRIAGNLYYVGSSDVTSYLITTPKGHILIDSGLPETVPQIKKNIATLGFKLEDIKIILNSHAHFDHAGGIAELRRLTKAVFYASEKDSALLMRGGIDDPNYGDKYPFEPVKPDKLLSDGEKVKLGGMTLTANTTSGHTKGCTTWTTTVNEKGKNLRVLFLCSISSPTYDLVGNKKYPEIEADYLASFAWLKKAKVDIFLASHAGVFGFADKADALRKGRSPNPFIDPQGYKDFINRSEKDFLEKVKAQKAAIK
ncbi:MAG: subclass B3 metallo-beta-lactamase [Acidobacteriota bacterium]